ncbi:SET domain-containing protein [Heterostelium album PN500]|uniref:SET domain-containing protein n=1 Tax=Heterostelium pallidum (strain ATCC 26659 / Pp 5 / PN500) TaxID=670386 RepID=D3BCF2_HETP5|nr:SET domain-containing protein [Heterostelium album PN500]EFA80942.1 SET domain-containing protein [Heterostelium album PN500]|eukprot:XP_020433060.1 SET domain-containing protein [Heterostelium album PN500]
MIKNCLISRNNVIGSFIRSSTVSVSIKRYCTNSSTTNQDQTLNSIYSRIIGANNHNKLIIKDSGDSLRGRGLFTKLDVQSGQVIYTEKPFVSYQSLEIDNKTICNHCLKSLDKDKIEKSKQKKDDDFDDLFSKCVKCSTRYCSEQCKSESDIQYHLASCPSTSGFSEILKYTAVEKRRFPILAAKILARILLGYHFQKNMEHWENLQVLSFAKRDPPLEWKDDYNLFQRALLTKESNKKRFNYDWFVRVMQILYINTLGIEVGATEPKAASTSSGIGLFYLTSFINHSCDPNCYLAFPTDHTAHLTALKPLKAGDELLIAYGDPNKDYIDRQSHLFDNYGFSCNCSKCQSDLPKKKKNNNNNNKKAE